MSSSSAGHHPDSDASFESEHVHQVYEQIASHFSSTRYKPWPVVARFLESLPAGSIGVDAGCGNGKNLAVNSSVYILASDRSSSLVKIANQHEPHDALVADLLALPHPERSFDFALSIAAIHHLSTRERRIAAVRALLALLRPPHGKVLIFVWALEQKNSRRGWSEGDEQDVMVPWVMTAQKGNLDAAPSAAEAGKTYHRYYHLYRKGELEEDIKEAGGRVLESEYEKDNWWAIAAYDSGQ